MRAAVRRLKRDRATSRFDTSDIVQEGMLQLVQGVNSFRGTTEAEFDAWVRQIARGHTLNADRHQRAKCRDICNEIEGISHAMSGQQSTPDEELTKAETLDQLSLAIQQLDDRQQTVILSHIFERMSFSAIAEKVGCSTSTASREYDRAITVLAQLMEDTSQ